MSIVKNKIIYTNKTNRIPTAREVIKDIISFKINIILIGSEAGKIYGLCDSLKDIDFLANNSTENTEKLFNYLKNFFDIHDINEFNKLDRIFLNTMDKPVEIFINPNFIGCNYDILKNNSHYITFYGSLVSLINIKDYIKYCVEYAISNNLSYTDKNSFFYPLSQEKINKYLSIMKQYNKLSLNLDQRYKDFV
jgi:hypothetical protein